MGGEWKQTTVGEVTDRVTKGTTPTTLGGRFVEHGISFVKVESLAEDGRILPDKLAHIDAATDALLPRSRLEQDDILFTIAGTIGRAALVPSWLLPANTNQAVAIVRPKRGVIDPRFLFYVLRDESRVKHAQTRVVQSVQANFSLGELSSLEIPLPPLAEQKAIAAVLGALDDKIELNRLMNATLEAMARALFQSWFVDFDPVRAKLAGRIPVGMDDITAALFSSTFQESSLGHVPNGWTVGNFGHVVAAARERIGDSEAVVLSAVSSSNLVRSDEHFNKQVYSKSISNYLKVRRWDFAYNPSRINIGSIGMLKESVVGAVSPVYEVFRPSATYHWFVERALAQPDVKIWIQTLCSGSVRQSLKLRDLASIPLVIPHPSVVQAFNKTWEQWHELIQKNEKESRTLATLRDTLLPKLLSGELSVAEATGNRDFQVQPGMPKP